MFKWPRSLGVELYWDNLKQTQYRSGLVVIMCIIEARKNRGVGVGLHQVEVATIQGVHGIFRGWIYII